MNRHRNWLATVERIGNRLPHPVLLFVLATAAVAVLSALLALAGVGVARPDSQEIIPIRNLLNAEGLGWWLTHAVGNFVHFPPLGVVVVGMLGIGLAEHSGLLAAVLTRLARCAPPTLLTPMILFLGIMSSVGLDCGYVVLPPLAAALYLAAGRAAAAGIAAAFAGVAGGYSANLLLTGLDPLLAGLTQAGANLIQPDYAVAVTANWYFMMASTFLLTGLGWWISARYVEPRMAQDLAVSPISPASGSAVMEYDTASRKGLRAAGITFLLWFGAILLAVLLPGGTLAGQGEKFPRWVEAAVPLLALGFALPGIVYGVIAGTISNSTDAAELMHKTLATLAPYILLAFFASQFVECFKYTHLGEWLALRGGEWLVAMGLPVALMLLGFMWLTMGSDLFMASASAKYALFAPVFVPMFMHAGIAPELTQAAYRIGDSVSNIISPLNPYIIVVLTCLQRYVPHAGVGTLVAMMLPYAIGFGVLWPLFLLLWHAAGLPLGI